MQDVIVFCRDSYSHLGHDVFGIIWSKKKDLPVVGIAKTQMRADKVVHVCKIEEISASLKPKENDTSQKYVFFTHA